MTPNSQMQLFEHRRSPSRLPDFLNLISNVALMAGAGAGKTHNLISMCLCLLGGARKGQVVEPASLFVLTFTDKAASELRERLSMRLEALATEVSNAENIELAALFERLNQPFPKASLWKKIHAEISLATVGTFHSLCVNLLRRAPVGMGILPSFELLDEREASKLTQSLAEQLVLTELENGNPEVENMCRQYGFHRPGSRSAGLVEHLVHVFQKLREEGMRAHQVNTTDETTAVAGFDEAVAYLQRHVGETLRQAPVEWQADFVPLLRQMEVALDGMTVENFLQESRFPSIERALSTSTGKSMRLKRKAPGSLLQLAHRLAVGHAESDTCGLPGYFAAVQSAILELAFRGLLEKLEKAHREELSRSATMDFSELLIRTRELLQTQPLFRSEVQSRVKALLVDEFQDTNRLQLELVTLLSERREGAPRNMSTPEMPLEPGFLCVVGDRKQSIYEFRGADVSVFETLAKKIASEGGQRQFLQNNWRSQPGLLRFYNPLFARLMKTESQLPFEVQYVPKEDDLNAVRESAHSGPLVERLIWDGPKDAKSEVARMAEAELIAQRVRKLLDSNLSLETRKGLRSIQGRDVAVLFRRLTHVETYRHAFIRWGIPHRIVGGRGFYGSLEVTDAVAFLKLLINPTDDMACFAVLRSPWVTLSDASLVLLAKRIKGRIDVLEFIKHAQTFSAVLPFEEGRRFLQFLKVYAALHRERDVLSVQEILKTAMDETGFRLSWAASMFAEQALANLDKLVTFAAEWDRRHIGDLEGFTLALSDAYEDDAKESLADVIDSDDERAVVLLTIHQAKGLEWPVVVLPDLCSPEVERSSNVVFERELGVAMKTEVTGTEKVASPRFERLAERKARQAQAESVRLLYVALTRARDRVILAGKKETKGNHWWKKMTDALEEDEGLRQQVVDIVRQPATSTGLTFLDSSNTEGQVERVQLVCNQVLSSPLQPALTWVLPVTHVQTFLECPKRYYLAHQTGLMERHNGGYEKSTDDLGMQNAQKLGIAAHRLLELTPLEIVGTSSLRAALQELLIAQGFELAAGEAEQVLQWVLSFWNTSLAGQMKARGWAHVQREWPFVLRLSAAEGPSLVLRGQIDLVFQVDDYEVVVVDFKARRKTPLGALSHQTQLACYALAVKKRLGQRVRVRAGISYLREVNQEPDLLDESCLELEKLEPLLLQSASSMASLRTSKEWKGIDLKECKKLGCGYLYHCHSS